MLRVGNRYTGPHRLPHRCARDGITIESDSVAARPNSARVELAVPWRRTCSRCPSGESLHVKQSNPHVKGVLASLFREYRRGGHGGDLRLVYGEANAAELLQVRTDDLRRWSVTFGL